MDARIPPFFLITLHFVHMFPGWVGFDSELNLDKVLFSSFWMLGDACPVGGWGVDVHQVGLGITGRQGGRVNKTA